jgi:hypothetical protein
MSCVPSRRRIWQPNPGTSSSRSLPLPSSFGLCACSGDGRDNSASALPVTRTYSRSEGALGNSDGRGMKANCSLLDAARPAGENSCICFESSFYSPTSLTRISQGAVISETLTLIRKSLTSGHDQCYVIVLFSSAELLQLFNNGSD